jgi:hypothetical protein
MSDRPGPEAARDKIRHRGQWILVSAGMQLLAIGSNLYHAISARAGLDFVARRGLLPLLHAAVATGSPASGLPRLAGRKWAMRAIPIRSVRPGPTLAVLGCYDEVGRNLSARPLVGAWEWEVPSPGQAQEYRVYWSSEMYAVYGTPPERRDWFYGSRWLDQLVAAADRPAIRALFEIFVADPSPELRIRMFTATPPTGNRYTLRLAGRRYDEAGRIVLRGITARVDRDPSPSPSHLEAVLSLSRDPICMIDPIYEVIYLTTESCRSLGLDMPETRHVPQMCHPDDLSAFRSFLSRATAELGRVHPPIHVRLAALGGGWHQLELCGTGVRVSPLSVHVWCRFRQFSP